MMTEFKTIDLGFLCMNVMWIKCDRETYKSAFTSQFPDQASRFSRPDQCTKGHHIRVRLNSGWNQSVIWLDSDADADTISHECFHAAVWVMRKRGIIFKIDTYESPFSDTKNENEEAYAYLAGFLTGKITDEINWMERYEERLKKRRAKLKAPKKKAKKP